MKISVGYASRESEKEILRGGSKRDALDSLEPVMTRDEVIQLQEEIKETVYLYDKVLDYILDIVEATRNNKYILAGISTRGVLAINSTAKTSAYFSGRDYVVPEDIKELSEFTIPHRLIFREEYEHVDRKEIIKSIIEGIPVPV